MKKKNPTLLLVLIRIALRKWGNVKKRTLLWNTTNLKREVKKMKVLPAVSLLTAIFLLTQASREVVNYIFENNQDFLIGAFVVSSLVLIYIWILPYPIMNYYRETYKTCWKFSLLAIALSLTGTIVTISLMFPWKEIIEEIVKFVKTYKGEIIILLGALTTLTVFLLLLFPLLLKKEKINVEEKRDAVSASLAIASIGTFLIFDKIKDLWNPEKMKEVILYLAGFTIFGILFLLVLASLIEIYWYAIFSFLFSDEER